MGQKASLKVKEKSPSSIPVWRIKNQGLPRPPNSENNMEKILSASQMAEVYLLMSQSMPATTEEVAMSNAIDDKGFLVNLLLRTMVLRWLLARQSQWAVCGWSPSSYFQHQLRHGPSTSQKRVITCLPCLRFWGALWKDPLGLLRATRCWVDMQGCLLWWKTRSYPAFQEWGGLQWFCYEGGTAVTSGNAGSQ